MSTIRLSKSVIGDAEKQAVMAVLDNEFLGMGKEVENFEVELADYLGVTRGNVTCVNTGTAALHLALLAVGIGPGDEVLLPSLTYVASFQAVSATGATAVACDINEHTLSIDIEDVKRKISPNTKAIMPVHYASDTSCLAGIYELAKKHQLRVIEDAAHSFGGSYGDKKIGASGDIICFSFDGIKNITSGEGGAVVCADQKVSQRIRDGRLLGVQNDTQKRFAKERSWHFDVSHQGFRYHMSDIMAAIGRVQLRKVDGFVDKRRSLVAHYVVQLKNVEGVELLDMDHDNNATHIFVVKILADRRGEVIEALKANNIQSGIHYQPNHLLSYYKMKTALPVVERVTGQVLTLPLHPELSLSDVDRVVQVVVAALRAGE